MINLLIINLSKERTSLIVETIQDSNTDVDYLRMADHTAISQQLIDNNYWDAVILSEESGGLPLLKSVVEQFNNTPVIFLAEHFSDQIYVEALQHGARDCISSSEIFRLPSILQREVSSKTPQDQDVVALSDMLSDIVNLSTEEIFLFDIHTLRCCYANKTAAKNLGYDQSEFDEMLPSKIYSEYEEASFTTLIQPLLENKQKKISICTNITRKMGVTYPSETHLKKITDNKNGTYILAINKDISGAWYKVKKLKRQRKLTNNYLSKYQQKEELLANAAHDMRTSLQSIILSNKLLFDKQSGDFQAGFEKFQKAIHFSGKHLLNYINEFFDPEQTVSHSTDITSNSLDLESFSQKLFLVFKPIAQRNGISFHFDISSLQHSNISTNQTYVKRVLKNLLANAFKFTHEGSVTFNISSVSSDNVEGTDISTDYAIAFTIRDTGIGIPKDQQKKIFGRHKRTENSQDGSGLGLHISQELTQALGGGIKVDSEIGKGSTFTLYLPAQKSASDPSATAHTQKNGHANNGKAIRNQNKTILVIDDSEVHNLAIKEYLNYTFNECITANSLSKAHEVLQNNDIDCIVTDYIIYDDNCLDFVEQVKNDERLKSIPIIVYTGKKLKTEERQSILSHTNAIVTKNAGSYDKLVNTIFSCFRKNASVNYPFSD